MSGEENNTAQEEENKEVEEHEIESTDTNADQITADSEAEEELNVETLQALLEKEKEQSQSNRDAALRAQAEMENLRKRTTRDIENAHKFALDKFVNELLPVIDSLRLGIDASENAEQVDEIREGMDLTLKMFIGAIEKFGVKEIDPLNEKFNPEQHEAVSMQEIEDSESGTVVTVMQKGYELNGRLVRPAMVIVAK
ncbi:MAG: nucleotide exchange factor GrpE [Pseudomonadota bacterium]